MGRQATEMLKGTLEGIVLAILSARPAYGYEITAWLREQGFSDIAEGTVYALLVRIERRGLVDVEKVPSEKGPPRKVFSLNAQGREHLEAFWRTWSFLAERLERLRWRDVGMTTGWIEKVTGSFEDKRRYRQYKRRTQQLPGSHRTAIEALERYLMYYGSITKPDALLSMLDDLADLFEQSAANGTPIRAVVGDDPVEFAEEFVRNYSEGQWINKERERLTKAIDRAAGHDAGR
jgi:PadR family transcriptional regulator, regulatory protein PadR